MNKTKRILLIVLTVLILSITLVFSACNRQIIDLTYSYNKAIVCLPDGAIVSGKVDSWTDFADGDQIQVKIDGVTYLVHSANIVLISE